MDGTTALVIIVVIFAVVALVAIWRYRRKINIDIHAGDASLGVKGENDPAPGKTPTATSPAAAASTPAADRPGINMQDVKIGGTGLAEDQTGKGINVERVETGKDLLLSSENPPAPKA